VLSAFYLTMFLGPAVPLPVPKEVIDSLVSAEVTVSSGKRSGFQMTFALSKQSLLNQLLLPVGYFDAPNRVILIATVNGIPHVLIDGVITQHTVTPSNEPGQSTLTLTGEDLTRIMDVVDLSGLPYPAMPPEARVALIIARYSMLGIIPVVIPSILIDVPIPTDRIPTQFGTDLAYINALAQHVGYVFYIEPGPLPGTNIAYWGPEIKIGAPQPSLLVNMDADSNVESLSFTFDGFSKTLYVILIQEQFSKIPIPIPVPDVTPLNPPMGLRPPIPLKIEPMRGLAKFTPLQAAAVALAKASKSSDVITASGALDVLRYGYVMKARQLINVQGAGYAYDGLYFVRSVTYAIKRGEFKQRFDLSRNALIPFPRLPIPSIPSPDISVPLPGGINLNITVP
jgi:hypothetical protein